MNNVRMKGLIALGVAGGFTFACQSEPNPVEPLGPGVLKLESPGYVQVASNVRAIGCAVISRRPGLVESAVLNRAAVREIVGNIDSVPARVVNGRKAPSSLRVLSAQIRFMDDPRSYTINCLSDRSISDYTFAERVQSPSAERVWRIVRASLKPQSITGRFASDVGLASSLLLAPLRARAGQPTVLRGSLGSKPRSNSSFVGAASSGDGRPLGSPAYVADTVNCGYDMGWACRDAQLPTVTVTGTPGGGPVVVDISEIHFFLRRYPSLSDFLMGYYNGPDCSNWNDMFLAMGDEIAAQEQRASEMETAINRVLGHVCERQYTEGGLYWCLDLFIQSERIAFIMAGDDRRFDPGAPFKDSRAQLYFNPATCVIRTLVNTSREVYLAYLLDTTVYQPHRLNKVSSYWDNGDCVITWSILNGWCEKNIEGKIYCPPIDGKMRLRRAADGSWVTNIEEDKFPSRGIYTWNGSDFVKACPNCERSETIWLDLISFRKNIDTLRLRRAQLPHPPGCSPY